MTHYFDIARKKTKVNRNRETGRLLGRIETVRPSVPSFLQTDLGTDNEPLPNHCGLNQARICLVDRCWSRRDGRQSLVVIWGQATAPSVSIVAWLSGRTSVFGRRTFSVLRSTCSWRVTTYVGKPSANGTTNQANSAFHPFGVDRWVVSCN